MITVKQVVYEPLDKVCCGHTPCDHEFCVGDEVYWDSCGTRKEGYVIAVIPPGKFPPTLEEFKDYSFRANGYGGIRKELSYLIAIPAKSDKCCTRLYYPHVKWLKKL
jgi:hypothetical protein